MEIELTKYLTADLVEDINKRIDNNKPSEIVITINQLEGTRLFANARLASLLHKCFKEKISIQLKIGEILKEYASNNKNWRFLVHTTIGYLLVHYADKIIDRSGTDVKSTIKEKQFSILSASKSIIGSGNEKAALSISGFNVPEQADIFKYTSKEYQNFTTFYNHFSNLLYEIISTKNQALVEIVCSNIAAEAIQNATDHALYDNSNNRINQIQFLEIKRLSLNTWKSHIELLFEKETTPVTTYLRALEKSLHFSPSQFNDFYLTEFTISDCGIGIPAKILGNADIYKQQIEEEADALENALLPNHTSKLNEVGAGFGLHKIMLATQKVKGLIVFRTGRLYMFKSSFQDDNADSQLAFWYATTRNYLPGTSISLIFPWTESNPYQQLLFQS